MGSFALSENEAFTPRTSTDPVLFQLRITLNAPTTDDAEGLWRRVVVPSFFTLLQLHVVIQDLFEWKGCYQHCFIKERPPWRLTRGAEPVRYRSVIGVKQNTFLNEMRGGGDTGVFVERARIHGPLAVLVEPRQVRDERVYPLHHVFSANSRALRYDYHFKENWVTHDIEFEGSVAWNEKDKVPACINGRGLATYEYQRPKTRSPRFRLTHMHRVFWKTYTARWPLLHENTLMRKCYMCSWYNSKMQGCRARRCTGTCCEYCLKAEFISSTVPLPDEEANTLFANVLSDLRKKREDFLQNGICKCEATEDSKKTVSH